MDNVISYRKTQFSIITLYTSSINMGTGHSVKTNPSNKTSCARDMGSKITCSFSWSVTLVVHCRLTEFPVIARLPLIGKFIRINCTKFSWKVSPTNDQWIHWVVSLLTEDITSCMTLSSCAWSVIVTVLELKQSSPKFSLHTLLTSFVVNSKIIINILNKAMILYTLLPIVYNTARKQVTRGWHSDIFCTPIFVLGQDESQGTTTENSG